MSVVFFPLAVLVRDYVPGSGDVKFLSLPTATGIVSKCSKDSKGQLN